MKLKIAITLIISTTISGVAYAINNSLNPESSNCDDTLCVVAIAPTNGNISGGNTITITGSGFPDSAKSSDYTQSGLVLNFDGVDNLATGDDTQHSSSTTTWRDLVQGVELTRAGTAGSTTNDTDSHWTDRGWHIGTTNAAYFIKTGGLTAITNPALPKNAEPMTVETVFRRPDDTNVTNIYAMSFFGYLGGGTKTYKNMSFLYYQSSAAVDNYAGDTCSASGAAYRADTPSTNPLRQPKGIVSAQGTYSGSTAGGHFNLLINGQGNGSSNLPAMCSHDATLAITIDDAANSYISIGSRAYELIAKGYEVLSYRVYNRVLGSSELGKNATVDQQRFLSPISVNIGGVACENPSVISATKMTCKVPGSVDVGSKDLQVNYNGKSVTLENAYTYVQTTITSVSPNIGSTGGGQKINIYGTNIPYVSTDDYAASDNLVLHYDALNNTGMGDEYHSKTTNNWTDLKQGFVLPATGAIGVSGSPANSYWTDNSWHIGTSSPVVWYTEGNITNVKGLPAGNSPRTVETVFRRPNSNVGGGDSAIRMVSSYGTYNGAGYSGQSFSNTYYVNSFMTEVAYPGNCLSGFGTSADGSSAGAGYNASTPANNPLRMPNVLISSQTTYSGPIGGEFRMTINGSDAGFGARCGRDYTAINTVINQPTSRIALGTRMLPGQENIAAYDFEILSYRIYDKVLTTEELIKNSLADSTRFVQPPRVFIGATGTNSDAECTSVVVVSGSQLSCTTPGLAANTYKISMYYDGIKIGVINNGYTSVDSSATYINSYSPIVSPKFSTDKILTINGNALGEVTEVKIGSNICGTLTHVSPAQITCKIPALSGTDSVGTKDIVLTISGADAQTLTNAFKYIEVTQNPVNYRVYSSDANEYMLSGTNTDAVSVEPNWDGINSIEITYPDTLTSSALPAGWTPTYPSAGSGLTTLKLTSSALQSAINVEGLLSALKFTGTSDSGSISIKLFNGLWG
ncbi:MAG: IPT/TIG domain-containing protein [Bifidobacteriaceae bacterium]|jgi:hypothetical protein|nr:IPT/TIG domain-containing protein [Bifidobacteriaceae bacterium]